MRVYDLPIREHLERSRTVGFLVLNVILEAAPSPPPPPPPALRLLLFEDFADATDRTDGATEPASERPSPSPAASESPASDLAEPFE